MLLFLQFQLQQQRPTPPPPPPPAAAGTTLDNLFQQLVINGMTSNAIHTNHQEQLNILREQNNRQQEQINAQGRQIDDLQEQGDDQERRINDNSENISFAHKRIDQDSLHFKIFSAKWIVCSRGWMNRTDVSKVSIISIFP